jgi:hypothetical protein
MHGINAWKAPNHDPANRACLQPTLWADIPLAMDMAKASILTPTAIKSTSIIPIALAKIGIFHCITTGRGNVLSVSRLRLSGNILCFISDSQEICTSSKR